jgi:hypothetical protein
VDEAVWPRRTLTGKVEVAANIQPFREEVETMPFEVPDEIPEVVEKVLETIGHVVAHALENIFGSDDS